MSPPPFGRPSVDIPAVEELASLRQWILWAPQVRKAGAKPTKVPVTVLGRSASSTDPASWSTFDDVCRVLETVPGTYGGPGFVFSKDDPYVGIDLDKCRDPATGVIEPWAREILDRFKTYTEVSPSGTGVHLIVRGTIPETGGRRGNVECYACMRFFCFTGAWVDEFPDEIVEAQTALDWFWWTHVRDKNKKVPAKGKGGEASEAGEEGEGQGEGAEVISISPSKLDVKLNKLKALEENDKVFQKTWNWQRKDLADTTMSSHDMALAVRTRMAGWSPKEIAGLIVMFRERFEGPDGKGARKDYVLRTVEKAIAWVDAGKDDSKLHEMEADEAKERIATEGGDTARKEIVERLGFHVERVRQVGRDPAVYFIVLQGGREVKMGETAAFTNQKRFMDRCYAEGLKYQTLKFFEWQVVLNALQKITEVVAPEIDFAERMRELLLQYLDDKKVYVIEELEGNQNKADIARQRLPFYEEGKLHISMQDAVATLLPKPNFTDERDFRSYLVNNLGFRQKTVSVGSSSRYYYFGPFDARAPAKEPPPGSSTLRVV